jgi:hypothetical protein
MPELRSRGEVLWFVHADSSWMIAVLREKRV